MEKFLCLLVHHGVWNENDHDVFKSILVTRKHIYQYVCLNKPLVQMLFKHLAVRSKPYGLNTSATIWLINNKREGVELSWFSDGKRCSKANYRNNKLEGEFIRWSWNTSRVFSKATYRNDLVVFSDMDWTGLEGE